MSNSLAIAAVTATLQKMLNDTDRGITANLPEDVATSLSLSSVSVTTSPPDKARGQNENSNQVNIYLYQTVPNAALRNMDMPRQVHPGETAQPPVALTLHYLLSAYGKDNNDTAAHILLGQTMRIFHDNAVLDQRAIKDALAGNDLHEQVERVRLTPYPLSLEDMSKLWTAFQTQHRISAAYQVEVVLIESTRRARTPLPVLTRGENDSGVSAQADLIPPFPTITKISPDIQAPPGLQLSAVLGNDLIVAGHHLDLTNIAVEVRHPRLPEPILLPAPAVATATAIKVSLPNEPQNFPAGLYTLVVGVQPPNEKFQPKTNDMTFAVAPKIEPAPPISVVRNGEQVMVVVACSPVVLPAQRIALLLGGDEVLAEPHPDPASQFTFVADMPAEKFAGEEYFVRLRVDGVDSQLVKYEGTPPKPSFDPVQKITIP